MQSVQQCKVSATGDLVQFNLAQFADKQLQARAVTATSHMALQPPLCAEEMTGNQCWQRLRCSHGAGAVLYNER